LILGYIKRFYAFSHSLQSNDNFFSFMMEVEPENMLNWTPNMWWIRFDLREHGITHMDSGIILASSALNMLIAI